ncbi:MAG: hypothetical protein IJ719_14360 [Clostridia bacterium]|nr:hypothetical protein [Clostridia bacterium]
MRADDKRKMQKRLRRKVSNIKKIIAEKLILRYNCQENSRQGTKTTQSGKKENFNGSEL